MNKMVDVSKFILTLGMLGKFSFFCCHWLTYFKINFSSFRNTIRASNSLDPDQARHSVGPDLGTNYLHGLSTDNKRCHSQIKSLFKKCCVMN